MIMSTSVGHHRVCLCSLVQPCTQYSNADELLVRTPAFVHQCLSFHSVPFHFIPFHSIR